MNKWIPYLLAGVAGLAFAVGRFTAPVKTAASVNAPASSVAAAPTPEPKGFEPSASIGSNAGTTGPAGEKRGFAERVKLAADVREPSQRDALIAAAIAALGPDEVGGAFEEISAQPPGQRRDHLLRLIAARWAELAPEAAFTRLALVDNAELKDSLARAAAKTWGSLAPDKAMAWLSSNAQWSNPSLITAVASAWAADDPDAAAKFVASMPAGKLQDAGIGAVVSALLAKDLKATVSWLSGLPTGEGWQQAVRQAGLKWAESDTPAAAAWLATLKGDLGGAIRDIASKWAKTSPEAAFQWAAGLQDADRQGQALRAVVGAWVESNPAAAAQSIAQLPAGMRDQMTFTTGVAWAQKDPAAAMGWALHAETGNKDHLLAAITAAWAQKDSFAASNYVNQMPAGPQKDSLIGGLSWGVARTDPEAAALWTNSISDQNLRMSNLRMVLRFWQRQDPAAAEKWATAQFPDANQRAQILSTGGPGGPMMFGRGGRQGRGGGRPGP